VILSGCHFQQLEIEMKRRTLNLPDDLADVVTTMADSEDRNVNNMLVVLIKEAIANRDIAGGAPWRG
jgi:hypothetical protein